MTFGSFSIKLNALACLAAKVISSSETLSRPHFIFSAIVVSNKTGSWETTPIKSRSFFTFSLRMSLFPIRI